jgi:hypothetical protein
MRSWQQWTWIYRPRIVWLVALLLLVLLAPSDLVAPAKFYLAYTIGRAALALIGIDPTLFWENRESGEVPGGFARFDAVIGIAGVTAATAGLACGNHGLHLGGALATVFAVDNTLWRREVRCRHELDVERGIVRSR